jgi:hypothetical protein
MARLNKKILCFVDEHGTAGDAGFALGAVFVWAHECGRADKAFSDVLPPSVNEVHASQWAIGGLQGILAAHAQTTAPNNLLMINRLVDFTGANRSEIYAYSLIETVKVGLKSFAVLQKIQRIGNVDVIMDVNSQNSHESFNRIITKARESDGRFKAVNSVVRLDSAASRMLQLADVVAYSRAQGNRFWPKSLICCLESGVRTYHPSLRA